MDITPLPVVVVDTGLWVVREKRERDGGRGEGGKEGRRGEGVLQ